MGYYPIFLNMAGRRCVVIGGGGVAERKVEALLEVGASVTVLSPRLTQRLKGWAKEGKIRHEAREYCFGDLLGYELAFVATDDGTVNDAVAQEGRVRGVWVNAADDPAHCDFILPSILQRGELIVAISTGGASPAVSRAVREELEAYFSEDYAALVQIASEVRRELKQKSIHPNTQAWHKALDGDLHRLISEGKREEARNHLLKRLGVETCR